MALQNPYAQPGMYTHQVFADLLDKAMDVIWDRGDRVPQKLGQFFFKHQSDLNTVKISSVDSVIDLPVKSEDGGVMPYTTSAPGFDKTFTTVNYRRFIRATDDMRRMDRFGKVQGMMSGLMKAKDRLYEYSFADVFNGAFGTTTTADGQYLCDTDHQFEDGAAGTASNDLTAAALSHTSMSTARVNMRKRKNSKGHPDPVVPVVLLIPSDLEEAAHKILVSEKVSGTALNDDSWNTGVAKPVVSEWLTDTNAWFLIGDRDGEAKGLMLIERVPANLAPVQYEDPDVIWGRRLKVAFTVGAHDWRNIEGNEGA